jgi:DNA-binding MurR/RpiR family transcriptional regulator
LRKLPENVDKVSTYTLRDLACLAGVTSAAFACLLRKVSVDGWRKEGRSFVRTSPFDPT